MPDVEGSVGVSEGENHEFGVNSDDALDVFGFFLDDVSVDGFVGGITDFTIPVVKVRLVVSANNERAGKSHLIIVRDAGGEANYGQEENELDH